MNFTFVTRKWKNKNSPIELVTWSGIFLFFSLELLNRKQKNKSLTMELVTRSEIWNFNSVTLVTQTVTFYFLILN